VAVKLFKGAMTSDGLPRSEMAASIAAGQHAHIVAVEGRLAGHPDNTQGLVLRRIPPGFCNLAAPPSLASCTRDVYADEACFNTAQVRAITDAMGSALDHLHRQGLAHGDFYAHNILVDADGGSLLGDFGAASFLPTDDPQRCEALMQIDRRALGCLVEELTQRCSETQALATPASPPANP
jgi:serine/threonine protein kinase